MFSKTDYFIWKRENSFPDPDTNKKIHANKKIK